MLAAARYAAARAARATTPRLQLSRRQQSTVLGKSSSILPEWARSPVYVAALVGVVVAQRMYVGSGRSKDTDNIKPGVTDAAYKPPHERAAARSASAPAAETPAEAAAAPATASSASDDSPPAAAPAAKLPRRPFTSEAVAPKPAGMVVRFGDISAFTDGTDVWLCKPAAHGSFHCNLTEAKPVGAETKV
jgi:hypothetical protein